MPIKMQELIIVKVNSTIDKDIIKKLAENIKEEFSMKYSSIRIESPMNLCSERDYRRIEELGVHALVLDSYFGSSGLFYFLRRRFDEHPILAVTDMYLTGTTREMYEGAISGSKKAVVSCAKFRDDIEKLLPRLHRLALHEIGHLNGLKEHVFRIDNKVYCPMMPGLYLVSTLGFNSRDPKKFDCLDDKLCHSCKNILVDSIGP